MYDGIVIWIESYVYGEYKVMWIRDGTTYTDIIFTDSYTEAAKIAAEIVGCDESIVMLPVISEEIDMVLNGGE